MGGGGEALIGGGSGGYVNLSSPSSSEAGSSPYTSVGYTGGSPNITFTTGASSSNSILEWGILALAAIFIVKEFAA